MRKKLMPLLAAGVFVLVLVFIILLTTIVQKYTPSKEQSDLMEYYHLEDEADIAVILNCEKVDEICFSMDGHTYLSYDFVKEEINSRFYWDANENILRYTTPNKLISVLAGEMEYSINKKQKSEDYVIAKMDGEKMYLAVDFVQKYTNIEFQMQENPKRMVLTSEWGDILVAKVKKNTEIREKAGIKSPIVHTVEKGENVTIVEQMEKWSKVCTQDGMVGYIRNNTLAEVETQTISRDFEEPVFSHNLKEEKINMVWHQVTVWDANSQIASLLQDTKGVNVVSPTWFYLNDNKGNIKSLASSDYVTYCHQNDIEVWALISNLENTEVDTTSVLNHTSTRDYLVNQIIAAAIEYDLDGINVDFEQLEVEAGASYVQFIRELSLKCRNNGITLSVDNYVPSAYTEFYNRTEQALFADYVVIMGYDEHYSGSVEGSVASIGFVRNGVEDTLKEVAAEQIILGMPYYTRVWECTPKTEEVAETELADGDDIPYTVDSVAVSMREAENRLKVNGVEKTWLEEEGQNYGEYVQDGKTYKIWVEDADSMKLRLELVKDKNLAGGAFWKLGLEKSSIWNEVIKYIN